jgi:glucosamine 6-phosphate synthetase-like amidotransferase/phosphosugar isomerase protein
MCGIIALQNKGMTKKEVMYFIRKQYEKQKSRGGDSFGVAVMNVDDDVVRFDRAIEFEDLMSSDVFNWIKGNSFIAFHHREASSTVIMRDFTHPFLSEDNKIAIVHNGVITSYMDEFKKLKKLGHVFSTYHKTKTVIEFNGKIYETTETENINDSEILLHLYEQKGNVTRKFFDINFGFAMVILDLNKKSMLAIKNDYPLFRTNFKHGMMLSSEEFSLRSETLKYGVLYTFGLGYEFQKTIKKEDKTVSVNSCYYSGNSYYKTNYGKYYDY